MAYGETGSEHGALEADQTGEVYLHEALAAMMVASEVTSFEEIAVVLQDLGGYVPGRPCGRGKLPPVGGKSGW